MTDLEPRQAETVVDPRSGEVLDLGTIDHADLVAIFQAAQDYERKVRAWRTAAENELVRRHGDRRAAQVVGDVEVDVERPRSREWDGHALEAVLIELVAAKEVTLADVSGVVKTEKKVDGTKALALFNSLDGEPLQRVRDCFTWKKGRAKVKITPVVSLEATTGN